MFNRPNFSFTPATHNTPHIGNYNYTVPSTSTNLQASVSTVPGTLYYQAQVSQPVANNIAITAAATNIPPRGADVNTNAQVGVGVQFSFGGK